MGRPPDPEAGEGLPRGVIAAMSAGDGGLGVLEDTRRGIIELNQLRSNLRMILADREIRDLPDSAARWVGRPHPATTGPSPDPVSGLQTFTEPQRDGDR